MSNPILSKTETLANLPAEWSESLLPEIRQQVIDSQCTVVVLDDDPTGTQTVYDLPVLTTWAVETLQNELENKTPIFYILTNSRSLPLTQAKALNKEVARNLVEAGQKAKRQFTVISRSDSTLRGHYPGEVDALIEALEREVDATLIIPFFLEGGRYTLNDIHYVAEGDSLVPAAQTPFSKDAAFGYQASNLREWVSEKTAGQIQPDSVETISIADLRQGGSDVVTAKLAALHSGRVCIINAASMRDLEVFTLGLLNAEGQGKQYIYRTAASFVQVRAGLAPRPLLTPTDIGMPDSGGGLVVVGSYVPKTTNQLNVLLAETDIEQVEVNVAAILDDAQQANEITRCSQAMNTALLQNKDVVLYTSRKLVSSNDATKSLAIGNRVSDSLVAMIQALETKPRYLLAKGGITSSDIATKGLKVKQATVLGQILPGIPLWKLGNESTQPGLPYIVFPGNVGGDEAIATVVNQLRKS